jgi:hypothetical protein
LDFIICGFVLGKAVVRGALKLLKRSTIAGSGLQRKP